jgi:DNA-binding response OmpR family regulator
MSMLKGQRILIIEDEPTIALDIKYVLIDAGAEVIGPANTVSRAVELAATPGLTAAIVDLRLRHQSADPVVERLLACGVPFLILSGQGVSGATQAWPNVPVLTKPVRAQAIIETLVTLTTPQPKRR